MSTDQAVRAVQYVRMSTDQQRYSIAYQSAANAAYAEERGYELVRTFEDAGVSGLSLAGRDGLKALLAAVLAGDADFEVVLVYDVSRWGRFQDPDQAAHYEFLCRQAGVRIEYTAEAFSNEAGLANAMVKNLKRLMAAEYSRELSGRVTRALNGLHLQGYWTGGPAPYGLQRVLLDAGGEAMTVLAPGDQKALRTSRTVLVPGPPEEVEVVRRIFRLFSVGGLSIRGIAQVLNAEGVPHRPASPWSAPAVRRVLVNEAFIGTLVRGRMTQQLQTRSRKPRTEWVRVPNALPPVISVQQFEDVRRNLRIVHQKRSDEEMLEGLRIALQRYGKLSREIIVVTPECSCPQTYQYRFGSLLRAYERIGYQASYRQRLGAARALRNRAWMGPDHSPLSDEELLDRLRALLHERGRLSITLIDSAPGLPHSDIYRRRFGGLRRAYALVGYAPTPRQENTLDRRRAPSISREEAAAIRAQVLAGGRETSSSM